MRPTAPFTALCRTEPKVFHNHLPNFSTIPSKPTQATPQAETLHYTHLLKTCLQECNRFKYRRVFDEMPQRLAQALATSKTLHAQSVIYGVASKGQLGNAIVDLYAKCGNVNFAEKAFNLLDRKDVLAWNSVLSMYSRCERPGKTIRLYGHMQGCGVLPNQFTHVSVLSACGKLLAVEFGTQVHCSVVKTGFEFDSFCEGSLIDMYAKCHLVAEARRVFDGAATPDTVSWTAMISGYVQSSLPEEALKMFEEMGKVGHEPDQVAFVTVITACVGLGRLDDARHLFSQMYKPNVVAWNVMISGHTQRGFEVEAITYFWFMRRAGVRSTRSTLGSVLSAIAGVEALDHGQLVHTLALKQGLDCNVYVGSSLINMYAKCEKMEAANKVFDTLHERNAVLWNAMLGGYAQNGYAREVLKLFCNMRDCGFQPDEFTYTSILSACACLESLEMGCQLHSSIIKRNFDPNLFVGNALVDMYAKCGALKEARKQFELLINRDNVSWNAIIVGYVQGEDEDEAFNMFRKMIFNRITPDEVSLASMLSACANLRALDQGKQVHSFSVKCGLENGLYAGSSLVDMYTKCGSIVAACEVLSCMPTWSVASINSLIAGYAQDNFEEAINLFRDMQNEGVNPSEITFASILDSSNGGPDKLNVGKQIHGVVLKRGLLCNVDFLGVSLLGMYMNSSSTNDARVLFYEFPQPKSTVSWTAMISGYTQNDCSVEALLLYREMRNYSAIPDQATFASVLRTCAVLASLRDGGEVHSLILKTGFDSDELIGCALVDMYAKCGDMKCSAQVFETMSKNDVISWNSMIVGFAKNGYAESALEVFNEMDRAHVSPDEVTFLGVLTACSHTGRVSQGRQIFDVMVNCYKIEPRVDHCACMVDLLGRWGLLKEAEEFISKLKFEPDAMIWASLLGACRLHGDDVRGGWAAMKLIELEPQNPSPYVLLSNLHAASGKWDEVKSLRRAMGERGVRKLPGCSWISVQQKTNLFVAGDKSHPSSGEIHAVLEDLIAVMKEDDYVAETDFLLHEGG